MINKSPPHHGRVLHPNRLLLQVVLKWYKDHLSTYSGSAVFKTQGPQQRCCSKAKADIEDGDPEALYPEPLNVLHNSR